MKKLLILLILIASDAYCGSMLPNVEDAPILSRLFDDPKAAQAVQKSQKAFLIQSGLSNNYRMIDKNLSKIAGKYGNFLKDDVEYFIDEYTPLNSKHVFIAASTVYVIAVKKEYTYRVNSLIVPKMTHSFTLGQGRGAVGLAWSF